MLALAIRDWILLQGFFWEHSCGKSWSAGKIHKIVNVLLQKTFPVFIRHHCQHHTGMKWKQGLFFRGINKVVPELGMEHWKFCYTKILQNTRVPSANTRDLAKLPVSKTVMRIQLSKVQGLDGNCAPSICWIFFKQTGHCFLNCGSKSQVHSPAVLCGSACVQLCF